MKYADLTPELERELVKRYQAGDREAAWPLIETLEGLLWSKVRRYVGKWRDQRDMQQTLRTSILEAILRFDPASPARLYTYVNRYAGGLFVKTIAHDTTITVKRAADRRARDCARVGAEVPDRVAQRLRLRRTLSLDAPIAGGEIDATLHDVLSVGGADALAQHSDDLRREALVSALLRRLPEPEAHAVKGYYLREEQPTLQALADEAGVSRQCVYQRLQAAMLKLRRAIRAEMSPGDEMLWGSKIEPPTDIVKAGRARVKNRVRSPEAIVLHELAKRTEATAADLVAVLRGTVKQGTVFYALARLASEGKITSRVDLVDGRRRHYRVVSGAEIEGAA